MDPQLPGKYHPRVSETNEANREPYTEEIFRQVYQYQPEAPTRVADTIKKGLRCSKDTLFRLFPIARWLPQYRKEYLLSDVIAGLTVAVMQIPQGMAYALLGGVQPVVGIYMALFPVFVYILMGTSPHVSMGSFAVVCMMVGKSVDAYSNDHGSHLAANETSNSTGEELSPMQVATIVCFAVGLWQTILAVLKLGSLTVLLSGTLVSGFTTGAAVHVFTSQVKSLLGLQVKRYSGSLKLVYTYIDILTNVGSSNYISVLMSASVLLVLGLYNELVKPLLQRKFNRPVPIPVELIIVVIGTLLSQHFHLHDKYNVSIVDHVPTGLPSPTLPTFPFLGKVLVDGLVIAIVAVAINVSMANIFAQKLGYKIDGNQEILASGLGNIFGSFFSCMPFAVSLSRSLIQESVGAKTQVANVIGCSLLVLVLLFIAPFFEPLPYCVLSAIIVIALKGMFMQFKDLIRITKLSKLDGFVWLATFLSVVILDIDIGLGIGLTASIGTMVYRSQNPQVTVLGRIPGTNIYKNRKLYRKAQAVEGALILEAIGGLHFANVETIRKKIFREILDHQTRSIVLVQDTGKPARSLCVVLSLASVPYMDPSAVKNLQSVYSDLDKMGCTLLLCDVVPSVYDTLQHCRFFKAFPTSSVFPTVPHAVDHLERFEDGTNRGVYKIC